MSDPEPLSYERQLPPGARDGKFGPFVSIFEAELAANRLRDSGIDCRVEGQNAGVMASGYGVVLGIFILVSIADSEAAAEILDQVKRDREERIARESPVCTHCGKRHSIQVIGFERWLGIALMIVAIALLVQASSEARVWPLIAIALSFVLLFWPSKPLWQCLECRRGFRAPAPDQADDDEEIEPPN